MGKFTYQAGTKNQFGEDKVSIFNGVKVSFEDLARLMKELIENEERIYPKDKGFRGGDMLKEYLQEVLDTGQMPDKSKHQLN